MHANASDCASCCLVQGGVYGLFRITHIAPQTGMMHFTLQVRAWHAGCGGLDLYLALGASPQWGGGWRGRPQMELHLFQNVPVLRQAALHAIQLPLDHWPATQGEANKPALPSAVSGQAPTDGEYEAFAAAQRAGPPWSARQVRQHPCSLLVGIAAEWVLCGLVQFRGTCLYVLACALLAHCLLTA